jgi:FkbM family methyltransferase
VTPPGIEPFFRRLRQAVNRRLGDLLVNARVGRLLSLWYRRDLPYEGLTIGVGSPLIAPATKAALFFRTYEAAEIRFMQKYLPHDADVIELGSSIGVMSCLVKRRIGPGRRLVAVEADPRLAALAQANLARNRCSEGTTVEALAISHAGGPIEFAIGERSDSGRLADTGEGIAIRVPASSLSQLIERHGLKDFALITDIEGAEWEIWRNEPDAMRAARTIIMETHDSKRGPYADLIRELAEDGAFELLDRYGPVIALRNRTIAMAI